jgi:hypothetical protein
MNLHKLNMRWLVHSWSTFGARMNHEQPRTHKTHHGPNLGESTTFPLIIYFVVLHKDHIQMVFVPHMGLSRLWRCITWHVDLRLQWGLKKSCSPCQEFSNGMSHISCTQGNRVDSLFLVVGSQIASLTPDVTTPLWGKCEVAIHTPKNETWESSGTPKNSEFDCRGQTLCLEVFFISLERSWSVDVQNGLAWVIWTSEAQVMVKRRARSQIGSFSPDH